MRCCRLPTPRRRQRPLGIYTGYLTEISTGNVSPVNYDQGVEVCIDANGNWPFDGGLWIEKLRTDVGTVSGQAEFFPTYRYDNVPLTFQGGNYTHPIYGNSDPNYSSAEVASMVTRAIAETNPSRPDVSLPNFIYELKDIPGMLRHQGSNHIANRRKSNAVEWNFGWSPLFQDLATMAQFPALVDKRVKEIKGLRNHGGLKRRRTYGKTLFASPVGEGVFYSGEPAVYGRYQGHLFDHRWVAIRWAPDPNFRFREDGDDLAFNVGLITHGWGISPGDILADIWEAVPWSWLADYFGNIGDYLNANRNSVGASCASACVMKTWESAWKGTVTSHNPGFTTTDPTTHFVDKIRNVGFADISASMRFLSQTQMLTLASIAFNAANGGSGALARKGL